MLASCRPQATAFIALSLLVVSLCGCDSLLTEGVLAGAGIGGAAVANSFAKNGAIAAGVGLGARAAAAARVKYTEKRFLPRDNHGESPRQSG